MTAPEALALAKRLKEARLRAGVVRGGTVSQTLMAELLTGLVGRTVYQATWSTYELATAEPPFDIVRAAAQLSGLSPGYIAFGETGTEPIAGLNPHLDRKLPAEEVAQAARQAAATEERVTARSVGKRRGAQ